IGCVSIILLQLFVFPITLSAFLLIVFLLIENRTEWINRYYVFIRFLLSRLHHPLQELKVEKLLVPGHFRLIEIFTLFKRNKTYEINISNKRKIKQLSEQESLHLYFKEKKLAETIEEIVQE